jgi:hypothetical protein
LKTGSCHDLEFGGHRSEIEESANRGVRFLTREWRLSNSRSWQLTVFKMAYPYAADDSLKYSLLPTRRDRVRGLQPLSQLLQLLLFPVDFLLSLFFFKHSYFLRMGKKNGSTEFNGLESHSFYRCSDKKKKKKKEI